MRQKYASATGPDQIKLYPRAFALRPSRVLLVLAIFQRGGRRENACPAVAYISDLSTSPLMSFSFAEISSPEKKNNLGKQSTHKAETKHEAQTESKQGAFQFSPEKKGRVSAAFQGGAFSPLPPGSNCLFCKLGVLRPRFSWIADVEKMSANVLVLVDRSGGDGVLPPWLESTPAVKKPLAVVRHCSHVPSFGGPCCPGVLRPVPADGDSSSSSSGSILPSLFSKLTYALDGSGSGEQGLEY